LEQAVAILAVEFPFIGSEVTPVTFIQPQREVTKDGIDYLIAQQAVFAAISRNPRHPAFDLMTTAVTSFRDFQIADAEFAQGVAKDPVLGIFRKVLKQHAETLRNLRELI
jgi:hypothetical protein